MWDKCINILDGAYSIVIINKKGEITLFRDIDGLENLYYYKKGDSFVISNTIKDITKFIKPEVNVDILPKYFMIGHVNDERTFLKDIYQVKLYEVLKYIEGKWTQSILYPDFLYLPLNDKRLKDEEIENEIEKILTNRLKFLTDMFPGDKINTLSGGLDSSLTQYILKKLGYNKSYCANVENYGMDAKYSRDVAHHLDSDHKVVKMSIDDLLKSLVRSIEYCEKPNVFVGEAKQNYMFGKINERRNDNIPILCFDSNGADAILGHTYPLHAIKYFKLSPLLSRLFNGFLIKFISKEYYLKNRAIIEAIKSKKFSSDILCTIWTDNNTRKCIRQAFNRSDLSSIFETEAKESKKFLMNIIEKIYRLQLEIGEIKPINHIKHQLAKRDNIFIAFPFRDENCIKFLFDVPTERKIMLNVAKYFEKKLLSRYFPKKIVYRKKIGENINYQELFRNNNRFVRIIKEIKKTNYKYFDFDLDKIFYEEGYEAIALKLITFHIWHKLFIDNIKYEDVIKRVFQGEVV
jgi:asparagine synthetase B (glutamine-hydrolysing)